MYIKTIIGLAPIFFFTNILAQPVEFSNSELCKAAISSEMSRKVKTIRNVSSSNAMPEIEYTRNDGDKFRYQCRFNGNQIVWRTYFNDKLRTGWGRWRENESGDSRITFKINDRVLMIFNSSTESTYMFNKKDF